MALESPFRATYIGKSLIASKRGSSDDSLLWCFTHNTRILEQLAIWKIAQGLQPEGDEELLGGHEGVRRSPPG